MITTPPLRLFRWLGAKSHLVPTLAPVLRTQLAGGGRLISLFYGTGALEQTVGRQVQQIAAEANPDLRALCRALARAPLEVDGALHQLDHETARTEEGFASVRATAPEQLDDVARAARFLWLSGFAFNGIWRVNRDGFFNVPSAPDRLARPWPLPRREQIEALGGRLQYVHFVDDWREVLQLARAGDLVLSDPPYLGGFVAYTAGRFSDTDQVELAEQLAAATAAGVAVLAFNSQEARPLYARWAHVKTVSRSGRVSSCGRGRGRVEELIVTAGLRGPKKEAA